MCVEGVQRTKNIHREKNSRVSAGDLNVGCLGMPSVEPCRAVSMGYDD